MTTITKERIELFIKNPLENGLTRGEQMELTWQLRKAKPDCKLPDKAMSYLERNGLISVEDILR
ncbi:TPA: hypothetical protein ACNRDZ_003773 [Escherichia coli]